MNGRIAPGWVIVRTSAIAFVLGLAACGGGGGESTEVGNSPVTDNPAPQPAPSPAPSPTPEDGQSPALPPEDSGGDDDSVNSGGPEPRLYVSADDPTFARITRNDGSTVTYSGTRDAQGYPEVLRQLVIGAGDFDQDKDSIIQIDATGRTTQIESAENGRLKIAYGNDATVRFVWTSPESGDHYEITLSDPTIAQAGQIIAQAVPSSGTVTVTCSRNGLTLPQPGSPPRVWEEVTDSSGLVIEERALPVGDGVNGTFPYYLPHFGREQTVALDETLSINRTIEAVRSNCSKQSGWFVNALSSLPELIADKVREDLSAPVSVRRQALRRANSLVELVVNTVCDTETLAEQLLSQALTTAFYRFNQIRLNAQVITAVASSEKISWRFPVNAPGIPEQTVVLPGEACPTRSLEGSWDGSLSQPNNLNSPEFRYALRDMTQAGNRVSGRSLIESISYPGCAAEIAVEGSVTLNYLTLEDVSLTSSQGCPQNWFWCRKTGFFEVSRVNGAIELNGDWTPAESSCEPGSSRLRQN